MCLLSHIAKRTWHKVNLESAAFALDLFFIALLQTPYEIKTKTKKNAFTQELLRIIAHTHTHT